MDGLVDSLLRVTRHTIFCSISEEREGKGGRKGERERWGGGGWRGERESETKTETSSIPKHNEDIK